METKKQAILKIQSHIRRTLANHLTDKDFIEISPVILSPMTDPLNHPTSPGNIVCYGKKYHLTQSMIFNKQAAMKTLDKIFVFSPNVRLEPVDKSKTGRHLFEFSQLDLEVRDAKREYIISLCEEMIVNLIKKVKEECPKELKVLGRDLKIPKVPFKKISYKEVYEKYGKEFETVISKQSKDPVWIVDMPIMHREFYDREHDDKPGFLADMDLIYPEGYGEALSGGEREYKYEKIKRRMKIKGKKISEFKEYLNLAKEGLPPSAGFGIGIERLTRFICGLDSVDKASLFPKVPGKSSI
ncbi:MAG: asparagine synthetase A [Candidatus Thermoplasmatota archaeon]|nr:asparagine synthetase A [Candidatus Thermoplasmatota archaeon]